MRICCRCTPNSSISLSLKPFFLGKVDSTITTERFLAIFSLPATVSGLLPVSYHKFGPFKKLSSSHFSDAIHRQERAAGLQLHLDVLLRHGGQGLEAHPGGGDAGDRVGGEGRAHHPD